MPFDRTSFLNRFLHEHVGPRAQEISESPVLMVEILSLLTEELRAQDRATPEAPLLFTNEELELFFSYSTSLSFTLWQHLGAVELLSREKDWTSGNPKIWRSIATWERLGGFGTTHLAKPVDPLVTGIEVEGGYQVNGIVPWFSGFGLIDDLVLGFDAGDFNVLSFVPFFKNSTQTQKSIEVRPYELSTLNGTSSVAIFLKDFFVPSEQVFSKANKSLAKSRPHTRFVFPELGIARGALRETEHIVREKPENARLQTMNENLQELRQRIQEIENERRQDDAVNNTDLIIKKDWVVRDSVRFLTLAAGASALKKDSPAFRYHTELLLWDAVVQSPFVMRRKILETAKGK